MHTQHVEWEQWDSHEYHALEARLRDEKTRRDYTHRNGVILGFIGGYMLYGLIYAVWTVATWVTR